MADAEALVREVEAFYGAYIDGFNREDSDAFLQSFAYPHALLTGERGMLVTATAADQRRFYQQTMTSLHGRGWGRSGVDRLRVWPFADDFAMLLADVTRYKKDESVLEKVRACYMARRESGTWKILAFMEIKPPFSGPGAETRTPEASTIAREAEAFYRAFIDGFNREDTDMYLRSFGYPNALLSGERGLTVNAKESDQQRFYQEVMSSIQGRGWERTGVDRLQAWPLADSVAMLMADITRHKKDGSVLERGRFCYTVRKDGGAWKIMTLTEVKPPFPGPGEPRG
ncbi:MAG TPA: hypothetical protein VKJ47_00040 [Candidatus Binatia bacterium]|nr:hypothetical protein [Candidatus Binatia bacterium]